MSLCHCGSGEPFASCCGPILSGAQPAATAEALMRARFSAYAAQQIDFLGESLHPDHCKDWDREATGRWAKSSQWVKLEIRNRERGGVDDDQGTVEFVATFKEKGVLRQHHETSRFAKLNGRWYYVDGDMPEQKTLRNKQKVGRNDPCPCGSGNKYKKCCGAN